MRTRGDTKKACAQLNKIQDGTTVASIAVLGSNSVGEAQVSPLFMFCFTPWCGAAVTFHMDFERVSKVCAVEACATSYVTSFVLSHVTSFPPSNFDVEL